MSRQIRVVILLLFSGPLWFASFFVWFILSQAQNILGDPAYQSQKFIDAFITHPLPRISQSFQLMVAGTYANALVAVLVFMFLSDRLHTGWIRKGLTFGLVYWGLMVPWFEFYLPFNVMHEPFMLVVLEGLLWLGMLMSFSVVISFVYNFRLPQARTTEHLR